MSLKSIFSTLIILVFFNSCAQDKKPINTEHSYKVIVADLNNPWGFTFLPDGTMLITEKSGKLIHFNKGKKSKILGLPKIELLGQGGLMDIELHPNYKNNGWIYLSYASSKEHEDGANTTIMRCKLINNHLVEKQILYKAEPNYESGQHFGSRIVFDNDGFLYFSIGDRGYRDINPQDITRDCGKIYRLNDDGTIPSNNPFVNKNNAKKSNIFLWASQSARHDKTSQNR